MARKHGGLGRGLDALIPQVIPMYPSGSGKGGSGSNSPGAASTEVFFSDDEPEQPAGISVDVPEPDVETTEGAGTIKSAADVSRETLLPESERSEPEEVSKENPEVNKADTDSGKQAMTEGGAAGQPAGDSAAVLVRISQVEPNRSQPREVFEEEALEELADSIRQFGILQPLLVQDRGDHYEIIAGERRWRAALKAGLHEIPVVIRSYSDQEIMELSLIENIQRENLNPIEEAQAYRRLLEEFGLKQEEIAQRVSRSRTAVTNSLRLLKLEERVRQMVSTGELSMGQARPLLSLTIPEEQYQTACRIVKEDLSVREVEKLVRQMTESAGKKTDRKKRGNKGYKPDPQLQAIYQQLEERMKSALQTKVRIKDSGGGVGHLEIDFYGTEDLERLIDKFV